ncbi:MAG: tRNA (N(6)-L-threonylcarbamoyladenosine(37)-C(2))-methylthiotransferase MtaB [Elusimicrobiales bacterium]|nr:tRNA (N(6)-L-threonylcarbamoyladenosine(37)-C(2))-methylthiotransferase MtaB [Elusimicrobiales bacterium]
MKIYFKTIGCRVNQIESQSLKEQLCSLGCQKADDVSAADTIIINSCSVTAKADKDVFKSIEKFRKLNPKAGIIVTGCTATLYSDKISKLYPFVRIIRNEDKENIPFHIMNKKVKNDFFAIKKFDGHTRAFIKIQEGCNFKCSYCIVSKARPVLSSKPVKTVLAEIETLIKNGYKEIVLCGIRLGAYKCAQTDTNLAALVKNIFSINGDFRIRFSSIESQEITPELLKELKNGRKKFCSYFHIPFQSGSDKVLKEMNRRGLAKDYAGKVSKIRELFPNAGIFADIIVGYPTESEKDFKDSLDFVKKLSLSGLHVFSYSAREGTVSAELKSLNPKIVKDRSLKMRELDKIIREKFKKSLINSVQTAIVLKHKGSFSHALTSNFQNISIEGSHEIGSFIDALITDGNSATVIKSQLSALQDKP